MGNPSGSRLSLSSLFGLVCRVVALTTIGALTIGTPLRAHAEGVLSGKATIVHQEWKLPLDLNDSNLFVRFEVDSNFDVLSATLRNVRGKAWLSDPKDTLSLNTLLRFPVAFFDMGSNFRNETLQEMLNEKGFPEVLLKTTSLSGPCSPLNVVRNGFCDGVLHGSIQIHGVEQSLELPCRIEHEAGTFTLSGNRSLSWREFNLEDPDVLFLRVDPTVTIHYQCRLPIA